MNKFFRFFLSAGAGGLLLASVTHAHVVLAEPQAVAGAYYKAVLRVGHGCSGSATTGIAVQVPEGFQGAKPQPKSGWRVSTRRAALNTPYVSHGKTVSDDVVEIRWQAATPDAALPDDFFDEFVCVGLYVCVAGQALGSEAQS